MRILYFTDCHNSDFAPRMRRASYTEDILEKQRQLIPIAQDCDLVLCGGDIFHQKKPARVSYWLTHTLLEIYREYGKMYIIPGNHDFELNIDEVWSKSPIMMFEQLPNVQLLHQKVVKFDEFILYGFGAGDYYEHTTLLGVLEKLHWNYGDTQKAKLGVLHASVTTDEQPFDIIPVDRVLKHMDAVCLGHLHELQVVGLEIIAPGAISRGVLKMDDGLARDVGCAVFEIGVGGIKESDFIKLDVKQYSEVFYLDKKLSEKEIKNASAKLIEFVDSMDVPKAMTNDDIIEYIEELEGLDFAVKQQALRLLRSL